MVQGGFPFPGEEWKEPPSAFALSSRLEAASTKIAVEFTELLPVPRQGVPPFQEKDAQEVAAVPSCLQSLLSQSLFPVWGFGSPSRGQH